MCPRYPDIAICLSSTHPLVVIGATRYALRRRGVAEAEIRDFSDQAFSSTDVLSVCRSWVRLVNRQAKQGMSLGDSSCHEDVG
jgi:hypothetical protein